MEFSFGILSIEFVFFEEISDSVIEYFLAEKTSDDSSLPSKVFVYFFTLIR